MANFYGQTVGNRGIASRTGSNKSGITSSVQSYDGSVITRLKERDGETIVEIFISDDSSFYGSPYFEGTIDELKNLLSKAVS